MSITATGTRTGWFRCKRACQALRNGTSVRVRKTPKVPGADTSGGAVSLKKTLDKKNQPNLLQQGICPGTSGKNHGPRGPPDATLLGRPVGDLRADSVGPRIATVESQTQGEPLDWAYSTRLPCGTDEKVRRRGVRSVLCEPDLGEVEEEARNLTQEKGGRKKIVLPVPRLKKTRHERRPHPSRRVKGGGNGRRK